MANLMLATILSFSLLNISSVNVVLFTKNENSVVNFQEQKKLKDGIYLVLKDGINEKEMLPIKESETIIIDDYKFLEPKPDEPPTIYVVKNKPDVPLILDETPLKDKDAKGKTLLNIKLSDKYVDELREFTKSNILSKVAIIIGGNVVTVHKIREEIKEGKIQITRYTDNACEKLFIELQKDVKQ